MPQKKSLKLGYQQESLAGWQGKWIDTGTQNIYINKYRRYRKTFELSDDSIISAEIRISGDTRYYLYINGEYVTRGPAKGFPWHQSYDKVDIKRYLRPGKNCISVLLHIWGVSTVSSVWRARAGIIVDGEVLMQNGQSIRVDTNESWKEIFDTARSSEGARLSRQQPFQEIFDARKDILGWKEIEFDDSRWSNAEVQGPAGITPWFGMEERGTPQLEEKLVPFVNVTRLFTGKNHPEWKDDRRLKDILLGEKRKVAKEGKIKVKKDYSGNIISLSVSPDASGKFNSVLLDLGRSSVGSPRLTIDSKEGGEVIDLYYSMRSDKEKFFVFPGLEYCETALHDRYICRKSLQHFEPRHFKGYRYLLITFRDVKKTLELELKHNFIAYPVKNRGSFECSDKLLNDIWKAGEWTLRCCMLDSYVDCPDREQGQYMGDALIEEEVNFYSFGDSALMRRMIRQCGQTQEQLKNGLMFGVFPTERQKVIIPDFNFTWLIAAEKFYFYTGDSSILAEIYPVAVKNLEYFKSTAGKDSLLPRPEGYWLFLDWSGLDKTGINCTYNLWYLLALQSMQKVCKILKKDPAPYRKQEAKVKKSLLSVFYDRNKGVWKESFDPATEKTVQMSQHANSLAYFAGLPVGAGGEKILLENFVDSKILTESEYYKGKAAFNKPKVSSYFAYYVLDVLFNMGYPEKAIALIKNGWGGMLKRGATTYWETWGAIDNPWSICHAWSAHPLTLLSRYVLGVNPTGAKWSSFNFSPVKLKGVKWAKGSVPTPYGDIKVEWSRDNKGKLSYSVDCPPEVKWKKV